MFTKSGRFLFTGVVIRETEHFNAWDVCLKLRDAGLLAKPTHGDIVRLTPPICISDEELDEAIHILTTTISSYIK